MTLRFYDGFGYATEDIQASYKWQANVAGSYPAISSTAGRRSNPALHMNTQNASVSKTLDNQQTWIIGFNFKCTNYPSSTCRFLEFNDGSTIQASLMVNLSGQLLAVRGGLSPGNTLATSVNTLARDTNYYIEVKVKIANSGGTFEVKVNGISDGWINVSGADTCPNSNEYANTIKIDNISASWDTYYSDLYVCDGAGSSDNDFLGDCRVDTYLPDNNGTYSQFTGSDSDSTDNYLLVDDTTPDGDTTYVQSSTVGQKDTYSFADMSHTPATIFGVQAVACVKKDDAGARAVALLAKSGATEDTGASQNLSTSYAAYVKLWATDPNTGMRWTKTNFNAAEFGLKVAS